MSYTRENVDGHCLVFCSDSSKELRLVHEVDVNTNIVTQHDPTNWTFVYTKYKSIDVEFNANGLPIKFTLVDKIE